MPSPPSVNRAESKIALLTFSVRLAPATLATVTSPVPSEPFAEATRVPKPYLSKVLQGLGRAGVVRSRRGVRGGVTLTKSPDELTILEVVEAVEPIGRIRTCPLGLEAHGTNLCPLHRRLDEALEQVEAAFRATTLAEVLAEPTRSVPLCAFPGGVAGA